jgi:hypothetical protein
MAGEALQGRRKIVPTYNISERWSLPSISEADHAFSGFRFPREAHFIEESVETVTAFLDC